MQNLVLQGLGGIGGESAVSSCTSVANLQYWVNYSLLKCSEVCEVHYTKVQIPQPKQGTIPSI